MPPLCVTDAVTPERARSSSSSGGRGSFFRQEANSGRGEVAVPAPLDHEPERAAQGVRTCRILRG
jgi:hypothetical protein